MNIAHDGYIRGMLSRVTLAPDVKMESYRSGWLGDWLYNRIMPRSDGSVFRIPSPRRLHARKKGLDGREELNRFLQQCDALDDILRHVSTKDLQRIKIPFTISRFVRLQLGDMLRYLVAHNERHLLQAHRVMSLVPAI